MFTTIQVLAMRKVQVKHRIERGNPFNGGIFFTGCDCRAIYMLRQKYLYRFSNIWISDFHIILPMLTKIHTELVTNKNCAVEFIRCSFSFFVEAWISTKRMFENYGLDLQTFSMVLLQNLKNTSMLHVMTWLHSSDKLLRERILKANRIDDVSNRLNMHCGIHIKMSIYWLIPRNLATPYCVLGFGQHFLSL